MQLLKKFMILLLLTVSISVHAEQYKMLMVIGGVGGYSWRLSKILETEIAKLNGDNLIVDTLSSANGFVGINHFNANQTYDLTITTSSLEADVLTKNATVDYKVVKVLGWSNLIWITNSMSNIKTPNDIKTFKPSFIGVTGPGPTLIGKRMCEFQKYECDVVPFKSMSDMWIPFFNNTISTALVAATPEVLNFAKLGKLQIVGSTAPITMTIGEQKVPSVPNTIGGATYTPMLFLAARKSMPDEKLNRILASVSTVMNKPEISEQIQKEFLLFPYTSKINNIDELVRENANSLR
jgi:tripartite-type tricarboxylate transporter receptor subunit TctC